MRKIISFMGFRRGFLTLILFIIACLSFFANPCLAAPYFGEPFTYSQPDGEEIKVFVWGDEFLAYGETEDGYIVTKDPKTGFFCYAKLKPDGSEIISTGVRVGRAKPPGLKPKLRYPRAVADAKHKKRRELLGFDDRGRMLSRDEVEAAIVVQKADSIDGSSVGGDTPIVLAPPSSPTINKRVSLVLLASFPDRPQDKTRTQAEIDDFCNATGYTAGGNAASIRGYFLKQSNNKFDYCSVVTAWFTAANPRSYYTTDQGVPFGDQARWLITEGLQALKDDGFDFTLCDGDGDGDVDGINCFYAGTRVNLWADDFGLWPHSSSGTWSPLSGVAGLTSAWSKYQITDLGTSLVIGTWCHENGHMICNFPDLYSYNGNAAEIGSYSLMASSGSTHPVNIDPYLKAAAGWADIVDLNSNSHQRCTVQVDANLFYRYRNPSKATEYFIFEVRDNTGYEGPYGGASGSVNPGTGLVAYHALEEGLNTKSSIFTSNNPACSYTKPYELLLVEANQKATITPWYDDPSPDTNDAFKASGKSYISDATTPALKFWDATGRNTASGCIITNVSVDGPTMTFVVGAGVLTNAPSIVLSRSTIDAYCDLGAPAASQTFSIANGGGGSLIYTLSTNQPWLSCTPSSGTASNESDVIIVNFATSNLTAGSYAATITVTDPAASPTSDTIAVNLTVNSQPTMALSTNSIGVTAFSGSMAPQQSFTIRNVGGGEMSYNVSSTKTWLSLSPVAGTVIGEVDTIYVNLDASSLVTGVYTDLISVASAEASNAPLSIPVELTVLDGPVAALSPTNIIMNASTGSWDSASVLITNSGGSPLSFAISDDRASVADYSVLDSDAAGGPTYNWIDISALGSAVALSDDGNSSMFSIGFDFALYGTRYNQFQIGANGVVSLTSGSVAAGNSTLPSVDIPSQSLAAFWDDLNPAASPGGEIRYHSTSERLVVSWLAVPRYGTTTYETFQVVIYPSGRIVYQYKTVSGTLNSCTIGIQNKNNAGPAKQKIYNAAYLKNSLALEFAPLEPLWLSYPVSSGTVPQDNATSIWIYASSTNLTEGSYTALVSVAMNDIDKPQVDIPVVFNVMNNGLMFNSGTFSVQESAGSATVTVSRIGSTAGAVGVDYATSNGTATAGADYTATSGALSWNNGEGGSKTFVVPINNDTNHEPVDETVTLMLSNVSGTQIVGVNPAILSIIDDDNNVPVVNAGSDRTIYLAGGSWLPTDVGVDLWLDADDAATVQLNGTTVSNWVDKSGNGRDASQTLSSSQPTDTAAGLNGKHVLTFDGVADYLKVDLDFLAAVSHSAFVVTKPVIYSDIYGALNGSASSNSLHVGFASASNYRMNYWGNDYGPAVSAFFQPGSGNLLNYIWKSGASKQIFANGSSAGSNTTAGIIGTMSGGGQIARCVGHPYYGGDIAEIIIKTGSVTVEERLLFEGYLAHKWGIESYLPAGHPYEADSPSGAVATNQMAGMAVDPDEDALTITWSLFSGPAQVTFVDPGATNTMASFTKEGVYTLRLTAYDGIQAMYDDVVITVAASGSIHSVTYHANGATGGSVPVDANGYTNGATVTVLENTNGLIKTGYSFAGWNTATNGSGTSYAPSATFTINSSATLYAQWTANTYTVTLDAQGGTGGSNSVVATYGSAMPAATAPARTGYDFGGYYAETNGAGVQYYTDSMASSRTWDIAANTNLFAKWTLTPVSVITDFTVLNVPEGGTNTFKVKLSNQPTGGVIVAVSRTAGDTDIAVQSGDALTFTTNDWDTYQTVALGAANDGDTANGSATITCNASDAAYIDKNVTASEVDKHATLTVTNDGNGATFPSGAVIVEKGVATNITATANEGYNFANWSVTSGSPTMGNTNAASTTVTISDQATVQANFVLKTYTVSYNTNGADSGAAPLSQIKTHGVDLTLATNSGGLTKSGYTFSGWDTADDGSGLDYAAGGTYSDNADVTLYARWTINAPAVPAGLVATANVDRIDLSWGASGTATGYNVKRSTTSGSGYTTLTNTATTAFSDTTVAQGVTYYYVVSAVNAGGESANSSEVSTTLPFVLPFEDDFEAIPIGPLNGQNGWESLNANVQTNLALGTNAVSIDADDGYVKHAFSGNETNVWTELRMQPLFAPEAMVPSATDCTAVVYFNTNGHPVVYDGTNRLELAGITVTNGNWIRLTVRSDYAARTWDLYIDGAPATNGLGFYNDMVSRYEYVEVKGGSATDGTELDEISIGTASPFGESVVLTVISGYGTPAPAGTTGYISNSVVNAWISDASVTNGLTNYVCTGWIRTGSAPDSGTETNMIFTITSNTTITWLWQTNYWVDFAVQAGATGSVDKAPAWYPAGTNLTATATPHEYSVFDRWTGTTNGTAINSTTNMLVFELKAPSSITAVFRDRVTVSNSVPYQWLADVLGVTSGFESAVTNDPDGDTFTTAEEYWAGTDPTTNASYLHISSVEMTVTNFRLIWAHSNIGTYQPEIVIQSRASLLSGDWTNAAVRTATNGINSWVSPGQQAAYFRLAVTNMSQ